MTERRALSTDLTNQGKWQAEHGATPDPIVVLPDMREWTLAEGCRLVIPTMEHADELHNHGMKVDDVQAVAEYNIDALPELVKALRRMLGQFLDYEPQDQYAAAAARAALDAAIEHEDGAK
ncbi:hypothetical protein [Herbaspirillum sp.]|uniref:hypothetical protein n=1 Tax=Herbaspirillum sp. TaxID=1890675 RepID=UPI000C105A16|nr:hypothetical protein [Herbaspirillum sp.]MBO18878.1 hypothetical protein [Herbaspirillum sp.]